MGTETYKTLRMLVEARVLFQSVPADDVIVPITDYINVCDRLNPYSEIVVDIIHFLTCIQYKNC
jgi:hypothetical protein